MTQTSWSSLKSGNRQQEDYCSSNSKMKKVWRWNLKPLKKSKKWQGLGKKLPSSSMCHFVRAYMQEHNIFFSTCHLRRVQYAYEHTTKSLVYVTMMSDIYARAYHYVSSRYHFVRGTYARAHHHDSSTCHPRRVTCSQKHITTSLVHVTHNEWHVHISTPSWLQCMPPTASGIYARAYY